MMRSYMLVGIVLLALVCVAVWIVCTKTQKTLISSVNLLSSDQLFHVISKNREFWDSLTLSEWKQRNVNNFEEYMNRVRPLCVDGPRVSSSERARINQLCHQADKRLATICAIGDAPFDGTAVSNMRWNIGLMRGVDYEWGWPHTMNDVVILPLSILESAHREEAVIRTLMHEKVHVYQRLYPDGIQAYMRVNGFERWRRRERGDLIRPNPDLDGWVYTQHGQPFSTDVRNNVPTPDPDPQFYEHPYERMAIEVARMG